MGLPLGPHLLWASNYGAQDQCILRAFSHKSRFKIAMMNCNCDISITECTHEREKTSLSLRFNIPERGEEAWLVSEIEFLLENAQFISGSG